ncbi:MAG: SAM-dependent methyltransferase [Chloroflexota bacterium]
MGDVQDVSLPQLVFLVFAALFLLGSGLWLLVPAWHGVPWIPARRERIRKALELAKLQPGETLYDLGAGDGRVLMMAAEEFGAQAVGIEAGPAQCLWGRLKCLFSGSRRRVRIRCGDFYRADVSAAQVVFVYLTSTQTARLEEKLARELRPGARVVSLAADFPGWQPAAVDRESLIFLYEMPYI